MHIYMDSMGTILNISLYQKGCKLKYGMIIYIIIYIYVCLFLHVYKPLGRSSSNTVFWILGWGRSYLCSFIVKEAKDLEAGLFHLHNDC